MFSGRSRIERQLKSTTKRLASSRSELSILDEQIVSIADDASDAEIRALVSESPGAAHAGTQAARHLTSMKSARAALVDEIAQLESKVDTLLDRLAEAGT